MGVLGSGRRGQREAMSKVDTAWLRMETPTNLMMITGVLMLAEPLELARLKALIAERFLAFKRFRQKAVDASSGAQWETDEDFDIDWHVRLTALPGDADQTRLQTLVSQLASTPLDHSKPLWQFHLVERYNGGSALIARIHHCYADGIALVQVLLSLTDVSARPREDDALHSAWLKDDGRRVTERFFGPAKAQFDKAMKLGGRMLEKGMEMARDPSLAGVIAKEGGEITKELAYALSLSDDPPTRLKGPLGVSKRCAWAEPLDLDEVKTVGRALGATVNDVLLAAACGALRSYLLDQGDSLLGLDIRATVPVNLRPLEHARKLGNHFGLVFLDLPVGEPNPLRRLERIAAHMRELKNARQAAVTFGLLAAVGMTTPALQRIALELFSRKASVVATNVPGPQMPLYLAGSRVAEMMFWVPQNGSIGVGISILSYCGKVHFGLIGDAKRIPDPGDVIRRFRGEFEKLLYITLMEDWAAPITADDADATLGFFCGGADAATAAADDAALQTARAVNVEPDHDPQPRDDAPDRARSQRLARAASSAQTSPAAQTVPAARRARTQTAASAKAGRAASGDAARATAAPGARASRAAARVDRALTAESTPALRAPRTARTSAQPAKAAKTAPGTKTASATKTVSGTGRDQPAAVRRRSARTATPATASAFDAALASAKARRRPR